MNKSKVTKIIVQMGDTEVALTVEDAKALYAALHDLVGAKEQHTHMHFAREPYTRFAPMIWNYDNNDAVGTGTITLSSLSQPFHEGEIRYK